MDFCFTVHKLAIFPSNPGKIHSEGWVNLLRYIRDDNTLGLNYYADIKDAPVSDMLIHTSYKTEKKLTDLYDCSWQDCPETGRSTGAYIVFYQGGKVDYGTQFPVSVSALN